MRALNMFVCLVRAAWLFFAFCVCVCACCFLSVCVLFDDYRVMLHGMCLRVFVIVGGCVCVCLMYECVLCLWFIV